MTEFPRMYCPNCANLDQNQLMDYTGQFISVYRYTCPTCRTQLMVPVDTHYQPESAEPSAQGT